MSETMDTATEPKRPGGFLDLGDDDICQRASRRYSRVSFALLLLIVVSNIAGIGLSVVVMVMNHGDPQALTAKGFSPPAWRFSTMPPAKKSSGNCSFSRAALGAVSLPWLFTRAPPIPAA